MNLNEYLRQVKLNREDPDYQIEDFWYGLKNSMIKFYKSCKLKYEKVDLWSGTLNEYKSRKEYSSIEESIREYIIKYAQDLMLYENKDDCFHSTILLTNIKRWNKLSVNFKIYSGIGSSSTHTTYIMFDSYCCIKKKLEKRLEPVIEIYKKINDINNIKIYHISLLLVYGLQLGQDKLLDAIISIIGEEKALSIIDCYYQNFIKHTDKYVSGRKLCKRFREQKINLTEKLEIQ
jgi:hypothetical protein